MSMVPSSALYGVGQASYKQVFGVYAASVVNSNDPLGQGRVQLLIPQVLGTAYSNWADRIGLLSSVPPFSGQVVIAAFEGGDINRPCFFPVAPYNTGIALPGNTWTMDANGQMHWGPGGGAATDTNLRRSNFAQLTTDNGFVAVQYFQTFGGFQSFIGPSTTIAFAVGSLFAANSTFAFDGNGQHYWGLGGSNVADTHLYRAAAGVLATEAIEASISGTPETWHSISPSASGFTGSINYRKLAQLGQVEIVLRLSIAASTTVTNNETIGTLPAGYRPTGDNTPLVGTLNQFGVSGSSFGPMNIATNGVISWSGATVTVPAGGFSFLYSVPASIPTNL